MFPLISSAISGIGGMLGSYFSAQQSGANTQAQIQAQMGEQAEAEQFNAGQAAVTRDFNSQQANIQRQYETQMSNTAYQRSVADMKAAGINPIMAAGGGGASTPSVGMATSGGTASIGTPNVPMPQTQSKFAGLGQALQQAVGTAVAAKTFDKMTEEISNLQTQQAYVSAREKQVGQETETEKARTLTQDEQAQLLGLSMPGARFSAKEAEDKLSMPDWLRSGLVIGGYGGTGLSKTLSPVTDLISSAKDISHMLPRRSQSETTDTYGNSSFTDRWSGMYN